MHHLHVHGELVAVVIEDEDADAAAASVESAGQTSPEVGLLADGKVLLDVTGLGHGDDVAVSHVQDAVLLEDGAHHGLHNNAGGGVGDVRGLLVELLGEQVNTEVAVLAGGSRDGDLDDLAGTALEHQEVTDADVVAGDGDGVGQVAVAVVATARLTSVGGTAGRSHGCGALLTDLDVDLLTTTGVVDAVGKLVDALTERVVVAVFVVVAHVRLLVGSSETSWLGVVADSHFLTVSGTVETGVDGVLVGTVARGSRTESLAIFTLSDVYGACVGLTVSVNLNVSVVVLGVRRTVLFADVVLFLETGTAVTFFLTRDTDLFFGVAVLARRVLTFPSGRLLLGEIDFELLLSLNLLSLGVVVPVGRGEDAEGDGDASLKVQVDDFCWRERIFSYNLPRRQTRKEDKKFLWLLFRETKVEGEKR